MRILSHVAKLHPYQPKHLHLSLRFPVCQWPMPSHPNQKQSILRLRPHFLPLRQLVPRVKHSKIPLHRAMHMQTRLLTTVLQHPQSVPTPMPGPARLLQWTDLCAMPLGSIPLARTPDLYQLWRVLSDLQVGVYLLDMSHGI